MNRLSGSSTDPSLFWRHGMTRDGNQTASYEKNCAAGDVGLAGMKTKKRATKEVNNLGMLLAGQRDKGTCQRDDRMHDRWGFHMQTTTTKSAYFAATVFIIVVALFCLFICTQALRREQTARSSHGSVDPPPANGTHHSTATSGDWSEAACLNATARPTSSAFECPSGQLNVSGPYDIIWIWPANRKGMVSSVS